MSRRLNRQRLHSAHEQALRSACEVTIETNHEFTKSLGWVCAASLLAVSFGLAAAFVLAHLRGG